MSSRHTSKSSIKYVNRTVDSRMNDATKFFSEIFSMFYISLAFREKYVKISTQLLLQ